MDFSWMMLQGRGNYVCRNRAALVADEPAVERVMNYIRDLGEGVSFHGLREELPEVDNGTWAKIASDSEECRDLGCKERGGCYALLARQRAADAQVVVVNHALLCQDLVVRSQSEGWVSMLGDYDIVIVDELHELEGYAKSALGVNFSQGSIISLLSQVRGFAQKNNMRKDHATKLNDSGAEVNGAMQFLWMAFSVMMKEKSSVLRLRPEQFTEYEDEWIQMAQALANYASVCASIPAPSGEVANRRWKMLCRRAQRLANRFSQLILDRQDQSVRWLEVQKRRNEEAIVIVSQPLFVDDFLRSELFNGCTVIGMSATIEPDFIAKRLGYGEHKFVDVGTMFDYPNQALLYVPAAFPAPAGKTRNDWEARLPGGIMDLLKASQGRALLLFTSYASMKRCFDFIQPLVEWTCMKQGDSSIPELLERFKSDTHSVLFMTRSGMTGVDIQGEALSLVVLDKLVFASPDDPALEAETEVIEARGGNAFGELSMPMMQLVTEQAAGRLIRTQEDRGVFACMDSRLIEKGYGKRVVRGLPPMTFTSDLRRVHSFFGTTFSEESEYGDFDDEPF